MVKRDVSGGSRCEIIRIFYLSFCKNVVENFVTITLVVKESEILLRGESVILYNKITKISTYIILVLKKKKKILGGPLPPFGPTMPPSMLGLFIPYLQIFINSLVRLTIIIELKNFGELEDCFTFYFP